MLAAILALSLTSSQLVARGAAPPRTPVPPPVKWLPSPLHKNKHNAIVHAVTPRREVALSFDDGPDPKWTPRFLGLLRRYDARATFFLLGRRALGNREIVADELAAGHEIGNHTYDHPNLPALSESMIRREIALGTEAIVASGAPRPELFRPPFGSFNERVGSAATDEGQLMVDWDRPLDPLIRRKAPERAAEILTNHVGAGAILLAHDGSLHPHRTYRTTALVLRWLSAHGYRVVTIGELLNLNARNPLLAGKISTPKALSLTKPRLRR
jgi:peptidoglycan/xylan/chitin deacetylase (PgdA/CDA1 family)